MQLLQQAEAQQVKEKSKMEEEMAKQATRFSEETQEREKLFTAGLDDLRQVSFCFIRTVFCFIVPSCTFFYFCSRKLVEVLFVFMIL
jgi:hypothetical protein